MILNGSQTNDLQLPRRYPKPILGGDRDHIGAPLGELAGN